MHTEHQSGLTEPPKLMVKPGHIFVTQEPVLVHAVLGSAVATCLWDEAHQWGGVNHFQQPECPAGDPPTARYGNVAVRALVKMMLSRGSRRDELVAQILGGGMRADASQAPLAHENVRVAREVLKREGIRVISEDVGGSLGRKMVFDTRTGHVAILKVHRLRTSDWNESEAAR